MAQSRRPAYLRKHRENHHGIYSRGSKKRGRNREGFARQSPVTNHKENPRAAIIFSRPSQRSRLYPTRLSSMPPLAESSSLAAPVYNRWSALSPAPQSF